MIQEAYPRGRAEPKEILFPKDVLPTVAFLSNLSGLSKEFPQDDILGWAGKTSINGVEVKIGLGFDPRLMKIEMGGIKTSAGREVDINIDRIGAEENSNSTEHWTIVEDSRKNQLFISLNSPQATSMLLPGSVSCINTELVTRLDVAEGKLQDPNSFITEKDINQNKSHAGYFHYQRKIASVPIGEILELMRTLGRAILSTKPMED